MKHILKVVCSIGLIFFGLQPVLAGSYDVQFISWANNGVPSNYIKIYTDSTTDKCPTGPVKVHPGDKADLSNCNSQKTPIEFKAKIYDANGTKCGAYT